MNNKTARELLKKKNVVSVGRGTKKVGGSETNRGAIVIGVRKKVPVEHLKPQDLIPMAVDGDETDVIEVGDIKLLSDPTAKHRPAPAGVSIGHFEITAGTLGAWVRKHGEWFILSNNHILANINEAARFDPILQPGPADGGQLGQDTIANLHDFVPIAMIDISNCSIARGTAWIFNLIAALFRRQTRLVPMATEVTNKVDCALARPTGGDVILPEVLDIGVITGEAEFILGETVIKSGRTTGVTQGTVGQLEVMANVQMGDGKVAIFEDQVMITTSNFSAPGDSGSAILNQDKKIVGLLFAGGSGISLANRYSHVKKALGLD